MKIRAEQIYSVIFNSIGEINSILPADKNLDKNENTVLYGQKSKLDSLGLVNLIVEVEQRLEDELGISVDLTDEKALSQKNSPFISVKSLTEYIFNHLNETNISS